MAFADKLAEALAMEGVTVPEDFGAILTGAYDEDIAAAAAESNTTIAAKEEMIRSLKAAAAIETIPGEAADTFDTDGAPGEDPADEDADFDDFFTDEDPDDK